MHEVATTHITSITGYDMYVGYMTYYSLYVVSLGHAENV